ncbi:uncharacterized protein TRIVIDRAFT_29950 [Trichoderma virens Gv29-8]|uniref:Myb-like DNA-binding domain-containing protein n=1 Tax=Hypocrea virens (strain Gv29-8 / FGSC 10586) TaxID=413071 RepID=G9MM95_HYPVG|nr:uncharacterized protein TRIVIDRAFT_29950 [Trichoderma virens Gv29-8]EHK24464.1 hypothetical protein TRIVIDRAFT_29950 [Trichoderma virens Gv29-8]UKZ54736.1 hypothetical protein TrVGV298_008548 [Trichoderma virens]
MSKQDPAEQVRFLVSCIGHTTNGRPDFTLVAQELGIVSKAAAQKRYERMLKANGVNASKPAAKSGADDENTPVSTPVKRKPAGGDGGSAKKKAKATKKEESDDDIKDTKLAPKTRASRADKAVKKEPKKEPKEEYDSSLSGTLLL